MQHSHVGNVYAPVAGVAPSTAFMAQHINGPQNATYQHNRRRSHYPPHQAIQMQKLRQQHQHINYTKNNNNPNNYNNNLKEEQKHSFPKLQQITILSRNAETSLQESQQQQHNQQAMGHTKTQQYVANTNNNTNHNNDNTNNNNNNNTTNYHHNQQQQQGKPYSISQLNYMGNKMKYNNYNSNNNNNNHNNHYNMTGYYHYPNDFNRYGYKKKYNRTIVAENNHETPKVVILRNPNKISGVEKLESSSSPAPNTTSEGDDNDKLSNGKIPDDNDKCEQLPQKKENQPILSSSSSQEETTNAGENQDKENINSESNSNDRDSANKTETNKILSNDDDGVGTKNGKEKTPMCLVNELARYNKITHQYRLTSEKGPAHCKKFTVTLKLGDEEYSADGFKIKKAQHMAAAQAMEKTKYKHPMPKTLRRNDEGSSGRANITPTVALNALAMKLGQPTYYLLDPSNSDVPHDYPPPPSSLHIRPPFIHTPFMRARGMAPIMPPYQPTGYSGRGYIKSYMSGFAPPPPPSQMAPYAMTAVVPGAAPSNNPTPTHPHFNFHGMHTQPMYDNGPYKITLIVGKQKFVGVGRTLQQAKHCAAAQALKVLKEMQESSEENDGEEGDLNESDKSGGGKKSPISLVHEIGIKRNMQVRFKVLREEGPAHMRQFITACTVGDIVTEGEGNGKKVSKKRAAEKMLEQLNKLPPLSPTFSPTRRARVKTPGRTTLANGVTPKSEKRKRGKSSIKAKSAIESLTEEREENEEDSPVTQLLQIQQMRNDKQEVVFDLISKDGNENARRKEFIYEVSYQGKVARGTGPSKKLAKRNAAQNMLDLMCSSIIAKSASDDEVIHIILPPTKKTDNDDNNNKINNNNNDNDIHYDKIKNDDNNVDCEKESKDDIKTVNKSANLAMEEATSNNVEDKIQGSAKSLPIVDTSAGQIPGILILRPHKKNNIKKKKTNLTTTTTTEAEKQETNGTTTKSPDEEDDNHEHHHSSGSRIKDAAQSSNSNDDDISRSTKSTTASLREPTCSNVTIMKEQLLYLSNLMGFEVVFNDYPKGSNHNDFLTVVTLSTEPPQMCHGTGNTCAESQNDAARNALKILSELGFGSVNKN